MGLSQLFSGVIFCITSICIPQWFGIYHSSKITKISFTSSKEIAFNLSWNLWKQLLSMFFFNLYFSSANASTGRDLSVLYGAISKYGTVVCVCRYMYSCVSITYFYLLVFLRLLFSFFFPFFPYNHNVNVTVVSWCPMCIFMYLYHNSSQI